MGPTLKEAWHAKESNEMSVAQVGNVAKVEMITHHTQTHMAFARHVNFMVRSALHISLYIHMHIYLCDLM